MAASHAHSSGTLVPTLSFRSQTEWTWRVGRRQEHGELSASRGADPHPGPHSGSLIALLGLVPIKRLLGVSRGAFRASFSPTGRGWAAAEPACRRLHIYIFSSRCVSRWVALQQTRRAPGGTAVSSMWIRVGPLVRPGSQGSRHMRTLHWEGTLWGRVVIRPQLLCLPQEVASATEPAEGCDHGTQSRTLRPKPHL